MSFPRSSEPSLAELAAAYRGLLEIEDWLEPPAPEARGKLDPGRFPWPLTEVGYRAMEHALVEALMSTWREESEKAMRGFLKALRNQLPEGAGLADAMVADLIEQELAPRLGPALAERCLPQVKGAAGDAMSFGRLQQAQKIGILYPRTGEFDRRARDWLVEDTSFWIGSHFDSHVREGIAQAAREVGVEQGLGQIETARELKRRFGAEFRKHDYYWEVVGSAAVSRGRKAGAVAQLVEEHVTKWTWLTMNDERVCPICSALNGVVMDVETSMSNLQTMMDAPSPEAAKATAPWLAWDPKPEWKDSSGAWRKGSAYYKEGGERKHVFENIKDGQWLQGRGIADGGQAHGGCRCTTLPEEFVFGAEELFPAAPEAPPPREFTDAGEADKYARREWGDWIKTRPAGEKEAMRAWSSGRHKEINRALRSGGVTNEVRGYISSLKKAISGITTQERIIVYRGTDIPFVTKVWGKDGSGLHNKVLPCDLGFQAASMLRRVAEETFSHDVLLRITMTPGSHLAYVNPFSMFGGTSEDSQIEVLLPPRSLFRVTGTENGPNGKKIVDVEVVVDTQS